MSKELDVVVFGASGYTGKLVVEYLKEEYGDNGDLKWAIAGRSSNKLDAVKEELNLHEDLQSFIVDSDNLESCLLYTSPSPRDKRQSRMPSSA